MQTPINLYNTQTHHHNHLLPPPLLHNRRIPLKSSQTSILRWLPTIPFSASNSIHPFRLLLPLNLRNVKSLTNTSPKGLPDPKIPLLSPKQLANPRLDVIPQTQRHIASPTNGARVVRDHVLRFLALRS